jgi:hypothetical protein
MGPIMPDKLPSHSMLLAAIGIYLEQAYEDVIPGVVQKRVDELRQANGSWPACTAVERDKTKTRLAIRLGSRFYPHMKLVIDERPDQMGFFFQADSHDAHLCVSPDNPEYPAILALRKNNQAIASEIESCWEKAGLPTVASYWKEGIARLSSIVAGERNVA